jgi:hypothetical protein
MQQHYRRAIRGAFVDVVHSQRRGVVGCHFEVMRCERVAGQLLEAGVRGSQGVHHWLLTPVLIRRQSPLHRDVGGCLGRFDWIGPGRFAD